MVSSAKTSSIASFTAFLFLSPLGLYSATFTITNKCTYTVWPAILSAKESSLLSTTGFALMPGDSSTLPVPPAWSGRLWGRTLCSLDITDKFSCVTGDCGTSTVECAGGNPAPPITLVEFDFNGTGGLNLFDISLLGGFNLPVRLTPRGGNCSETGCLTNLNAVCPKELKVIWDGETVACKSTCQTEPCSSSQFFKTACSGARVYTHDNHAFFPCSSPHYTVTFCPTSKSWMKGDNKIDPSGKMVVKYTGVLAVISVICGFIIFQIRLRLSNKGWEFSLRAGIELESRN
ncbi:hypothetical protein ACSQ67_025694 [Phaseolus vulgaris]